MDYLFTELVAKLFLGRVIDNRAANHNAQRFSISLEATSTVEEDKELPVTPGFPSLEELEVFCEENYPNYVNLDKQLREKGVIEPLKWGGRASGGIVDARDPSDKTPAA